MLRREVKIVCDGEFFLVGFFSEGQLIDYWTGENVDWPSVNAFLKSGVLPG